MTEAEKNAAFNAVFEQALKKMQEASSTAVSSSYEVHRSGGEITVKRSGRNVDEFVVVPSEPLKKAA